MARPADTSHDLRRRWRAETLPTLRGDVIDIGAGDGQAAPFLGADVRWVAVEPSPSRELRAATEARSDATLLEAGGESIPLPDGSADAAILCTVLCSVRDPAAVLAEVLRVVRPGGRLVFFEHVGAPRGTWTRAVQRLYRPYGRWFDAGCDPTRDTEATLRAAGFASIDCTAVEVPGPLRTREPLLFGSAVR